MYSGIGIYDFCIPIYQCWSSETYTLTMVSWSLELTTNLKELRRFLSNVCLYVSDGFVNKASLKCAKMWHTISGHEYSSDPFNWERGNLIRKGIFVTCCCRFFSGNLIVQIFVPKILKHVYVEFYQFMLSRSTTQDEPVPSCVPKCYKPNHRLLSCVFYCNLCLKAWL